MDQTVGEHDFCVLDIETCRGDFTNYNPADFMLLVTGTMSQTKEYVPYESNKEDLKNLADFPAAYAGTIVPFNGTRFDLAVLDVYFNKHLGVAPEVKRHYDILQSFYRLAGFRVRLDSLCSENLGVFKLPWDHTQNEQIWTKQKTRLLKYNQQDLKITSELYKLVRAGQPLPVDGRYYHLPRPLS